MFTFMHNESELTIKCIGVGLALSIELKHADILNILDMLHVTNLQPRLASILTIFLHCLHLQRYRLISFKN